MQSWRLIQNVLMLSSPKNSSRAEERSSVRSELKRPQRWENEGRNGPAIIGCQKCHLLSACEWEEFGICCVMPFWRWITGSVCLIWHQTNSIWSHNVHPDRHWQRQKQGHHLFSLASKYKPNSLHTYFQSTSHLSTCVTSSFKIYHCGQPTRDRQPVCNQTLSEHLLNPELTLMEGKRIGGRPRNISRVLDNHVDIPDDCSTNINAHTNILQYHEYQTHANRWKDKMHLYSYLSPSHPARLPVIDLVGQTPFTWARIFIRLSAST